MTFTSTSGNTIDVEWQPYEYLPTSQFKEYILEVKAKDGILNQSPMHQATKITSHKIMELNPDTDYKIRVAIRSKDFGDSVWSDEIIAPTKKLTDSPQSKVEQLEDTLVSANCPSFVS